MKYVEFDETRPMDLVLLGRVAIDFNPAYNDQVKEEFKPLKKVHMFEKFVGGSPANIAVGVTRHGLKAGFFAKVPHFKMYKWRKVRTDLYRNAFSKGKQYPDVSKLYCRLTVKRR